MRGWVREYEGRGDRERVEVMGLVRECEGQGDTERV